MKTRDTDDFWVGLGMMGIRIDYAGTIKVLISSPVRWVIYFAPGRRQLKLKLRMRRKNSQLESTGGRCTKSGHFTPNWDFLQLWSVSIGMSVRSPNMKSNCLPCLLESSRYFIASPTITLAGLKSSERNSKMSESGKNTFRKKLCQKPCSSPPYNRELLRPHLACALSQPPSQPCPAQPWLPVH